jgi:hypothetical protein
VLYVLPFPTPPYARPYCLIHSTLLYGLCIRLGYAVPTLWSFLPLSCGRLSYSILPCSYRHYIVSCVSTSPYLRLHCASLWVSVCLCPTPPRPCILAYANTQLLRSFHIHIGVVVYGNVGYTRPANFTDYEIIAWFLKTHLVSRLILWARIIWIIVETRIPNQLGIS